MPVPLTVIGGMRRGALFNPLKRLALESQPAALGALFGEYGGGRRPAVYTDIQAEAQDARETLDLYDASPLGKIEVIGPGAAELLEFCGYVTMTTLKPGRARFGAMLGEISVVADDGVPLRLGEDRFILSASSSHVDHARLILEQARQDRFNPSSVFGHDVTAHWVTLSISGPRTRAALEAAGMPAPVAALRHMQEMETRWNQIPLRAARVSFAGDASWERSAPARHAPRLMTVLDGAREALGGHRIGVEALMILRIEKGDILIDKGTDGFTMLQNLGRGHPRDRRQDAYFGRRALFTPEATRVDRRQRVDLECDGDPLPTGKHLVPLEGGALSGLCHLLVSQPDAEPSRGAGPDRRQAWLDGRKAGRLSPGPTPHRPHLRSRGLRSGGVPPWRLTGPSPARRWIRVIWALASLRWPPVRPCRE